MAFAVTAAIGLISCGPKTEQRGNSMARQAGRKTHQVGT